MNKYETILKALEKAEANGYTSPAERAGENTTTKEFARDMAEEDDKMASLFILRGVFLDHEFAKAFWGGEILSIDPFNHYGFDGTCDNCLIKLPAWQYHLQNIVLEENPLQYIEKFL